MEAATMEHVQAEVGLVKNEVAITVIDELVKTKEGNEFHQGGEETKGSLYFEGNEKGDIESNDGITEEKPGNEKSDSNITKAESQKSIGTVYDRKRDGNPKNDSLNDLHPLPSEFQSQSSGSLSLKDRRLEVIELDVELDVERVIEEQDTHDLYCPNCNSCITKRVILRKRKRKIRSIDVNESGSIPPRSGSIPPPSETDVNERGSIPPPSGSVPPPSETDANGSGSIPPPSGSVPPPSETDANGSGSIPPPSGSIPPIPPPSGSIPPPSGSIPPPSDEPRIYECFSCFTFFIRRACCYEPIPPIEERGEGGMFRIVNWIFPCFQSPRVSIPPVQDEHVVFSVVPERTHEWDILKSIIYGGLIETITSLGVVSSAAAGDATSLNIVVLGLANLMSGLIIIIHNITELKKDCHEATNEANSNIDRYRETLGRRENFRLHAIVAVMSFLVFGLLPPVTYGFSFHGSDDKSYKLITCAAASLVCIILLSIGKAHVQKPPKPYIKTILEYLSSGLSASGFCYAVGLLINRFLQNSGWFETTSAPSTVFLETRSMKSGSAFYE